MEMTFELLIEEREQREEREQGELVISKHGYARLKERNGWSKKAATRMIHKVYEEGLRPTQVKGYLKGWINSKAEYCKDDKEFVLFGEKLYVI